MLFSGLLFPPFFALAVEVRLPEGFSGQYSEFLSRIPKDFSSGNDSELRPAYASFRFPFSVFNVEVKGPQSYEPGGKINLKGRMTFQNKSWENSLKIEELCKSSYPENYCSAYEKGEIKEFQNLGLFIQVWRKEKNEEQKKYGDFLIDEFYAFSDMNIASGENKEFEINWDIPPEAKEGEYYLTLSLLKDKTFDVKGSPLAAFSQGETFSFSVKEGNGNLTGNLELDKNSALINGIPYSYRQSALTIPKGEITIEFTLVNESARDRTAKVKYDLYGWSQTNPDNLLETKEENVSLLSGSSQLVRFSFQPEGSASVYNLKLSVLDGSSKSLSNVRFVLEGKNQGIFRFIDNAETPEGKFPLICARNASWDGSFPALIKITQGASVWEGKALLEAGEDQCFLVKSEKLREEERNSCSPIVAEIRDKQGGLTDRKEIKRKCPKSQSVAGEVMQNFSTGMLKSKIAVLFMTLFLIAAVTIIGVIIFKKFKNNNADKI